MALLQLRGIVKTFGSRTILDGLDFDVDPRARVGVIGPTGGGKSTLMRILAGLEETDAGGPGFEGRARSMLLELGLEEDDLERPTHLLSGGERKLAALAACLVP